MTVFISGGAVGIGRAIAEHFALSGANVAICYFESQKEAAELTQKYKNISAFCADVRNYEQLKKAFNSAKENFDGIDVAIANSGISHFAQIQDCTEADFYNIFDVNTKGVFNLFKLAAEDMLCRKSGNMIAVSSVFGNRGASCESLYSASKGAVDTLVKSIAAELGTSNIRVNAIACGLIDTKMNRRLSKQEIQNFANCTALQRVGTPQDIAHAAYFLATNNYITGQIINIDGGIL